MHSRSPRVSGKIDSRLLILGAVVLLVIVAVLILLQGDRSARVESARPAAIQPTSVATPRAIAVAEHAPSPTDVANAAPSPTPEVPTAVAIAETPTTATIVQASATPSAQEEWFGKVIDKESRKPIAGAKVELVSVSFLELAAKEPVVLHTCSTDEEGRFHLPTQRPRNQLESTNGLRVGKDGYELALNLGLGSMQGVEVTNEKERIIELRPAGRIAGTVVDGQGNSIGGARIGMVMLGNLGQMMGMGGTGQEWTQFNTGFTNTKGDGTFELAGLALGESYRLPVQAPGYLPKLTGKTAVGTTDLIVVLEKGGGTIFGKVLESDDSPVAGARIMIIPGGMGYGGGDMEESFIAMQQLVSAKDGSFESAMMKPGMAMLMASRNENSMMSGGQFMKQVTVREGEPEEVIVRFADDVLIEGVASNLEDGKPLAGVKVTTIPDYMGGTGSDDAMAEDGSTVVTAADGSYKLSAPRSNMMEMMSSVNLWVDPPAGWILKEPEPMGMATQIMLTDLAKDEKSRRVDLKFQRGKDVTLHVVSPLDLPAAGASIQVQTEGDTRYWMPQTLSGEKTDAAGNVTVAVDPGTTSKLMVSHDTGFHSSTLDPEKLDGSIVEIKLDKAARVAGFVKDRSGKPMPDMNLTATSYGDGTMDPAGFNIYKPATTNEKGYYYIDGLPAGGISVTLNRDDNSFVEEKELELAIGEFKEDVNFEYSDGETLTGFVADEDGKAISGVHVMGWVGGYDHMPFTTTTDTEGIFELKGIPVDTEVTNLQFQHSDYQQHQIDSAKASDSPISVTLFRLKDVGVRVVDEATNAPVTQYRLTLSYSQEAGAQYFGAGESREPIDVKDPEGRTRIEGLQRGQYLLTVEAQDKNGAFTGRSGFKDITVGKGVTLPEEVLIEVVGGIRLAGTVTHGEDGPPVSGATVIWDRSMDQANPNPEKIWQTVSGADGSFVFENVPRGGGRFTASKGTLVGGSPEYFDFRVTNPPGNIEVVINEAGSVLLKATGADGQPMSGSMFQIGGAVLPQQEYNKTTGADGTCRWEKLNPGSYTISYYGSSVGGGYVTRSTTVKPGIEVVVEFDFSRNVTLRGTLDYGNTEAYVGVSFVPFDAMNNPSGTDNGTTFHVTTVGANQHRTQVAPGRYKLYVNTTQSSGFIGEPFDILPEPAEQEFNIRVEFASVEVILAMPGDAEPIDGYLMLERKVDQGSATSAVPSGRKGVIELSTVLPGTYDFTFQPNEPSGGQVLHGKTENQVVQLGQENTVVVLLEPEFSGS